MKKSFLVIFILLLIVSCKKDDPNQNTITNKAPTANAGHPQSVLQGSTVTLDGSASTDPESSPLKYQWSFTSVPAGSQASLSDATHSHPTFIADMEGDYVVSLVVSDGSTFSSASSVTITATNSANNAVPISNAGLDKTSHIGNLVILDGSLSHDANGDPLTYNWSFTSLPAGSNSTLTNATSTNPSFTPDVMGDYIIALIVNDGQVNSLPDEIIVTVDALSDLEQLIAMGLDAVDANHLIANHPNDVQIVLADQNRIFNHMPSLDNMFGVPTDPSAASFNDNLITNWGDNDKTLFKKMFGRIAFVMNSPKFIQSFNANIGLLNPAYQGNPPAVPYPANYAEFRTVANNAILAGNFQYTFFISNLATGFAWGEVGLKLKIEANMLGPGNPGAPHNTEALVFHELTHTWGYTHDSPNAADYQLLPNNIPYYVQAIVGSSAVNPSAPMVWGTPEALFTIYFGN